MLNIQSKPIKGIKKGTSSFSKLAFSKARIIALTVAALCVGAKCMYPYFSSYGFLLFKMESEAAIKTRFLATIYGVETWYFKYESYIDSYIANGGSYYDCLPVHGCGSVTPWKLVTLAGADTELDLYDAYNQEMHYALIDALEDDLSGASYTEYYCGGGCAGYWDPYSYWKWRSVYMERMYAENGNGSYIYANCWGTADYLARGIQWSQFYTHTFPNGAPTEAQRFPHIFTNGSTGNYNIDDDLKNPNRSKIKQVMEFAYEDFSYASKINAFDIVRFDVDGECGTFGGGTCLYVDGYALAENAHSAAYLMTDENESWWIYEKHNFGNTLENPYGINTVGIDLWPDPPVVGVGAYENRQTATFKKPGDIKLIIPSTYDLNWAGILP